MMLCTALLLLTAAHSAQAQIAKSNVQPPETTSAPAADKADQFKALDTRLQQTFQRMFEGAEATDINTGAHNTNISFNKAGERYLALFTNRGTWLQTIHYYDARKLAPAIRTLVEDAYPEYSLLRVAEVNIGGKIAHIVDIETHRRFKKVRVFEGEVDVYQAFDKQ